MKPFFQFVVLLGGLSCRSLASTYYFDVNGTGAGSGVVNGGSYDATGSVWTTATDGTGATVALPGRQGVAFSAGVDATSQAYQVTGNFGQLSGGITVAEGNVTLSGGGTFFGSESVATTGANTSLVITGSTWDFYANTVTFNAASGCPITLNSIATNSGRNGNLTKTGSGLLTITGAATARGIVVNVNDGELRIQTANAFYNPSYPSPAKTYGVAVNSGGTLELAGGITVANNPVTLGGYGYNGLGALLGYSGNNTFGQLITLAADTFIAASPGASLTLNPAAGDAITGPYALTLGGSGTITVAQPISNITALTKVGDGTTILSAVSPFTGPTVVSAGTLSLTETNGVLAGVGGAITVNATLQITNAASQSFANTLGGASTGQITKLGGGALTLTAVNPFAGSILVGAGQLSLAAGASLDATGTLTVAGGAVFDVSSVTGYTLKSGQTLAGMGTVAGAVTCQSGAQISPGTAGSPGTLTFSQPLTLAGGVTAVFDLATTPGGTGDQINVTGNLSLTGTNTIRVNATTLANGTYPLIRTQGGTVTGSIGSLQLAGFVTGAQVASLQPAANGAGLDLVVANNPYVARNLTWLGDGSANVWNDSTANWRTGGAPVAFTASDRLTFDATGAANATVTISGLLAPGAVTVTGTTDYTFTGSGSLVGSMTLTKTGTARLIVTGDQAYTGGTSLAAGTIEVRASSGLGSGAVANAGTLVFAPASSLTFANVISGTGALTQTTGTTTLGGTNTFTGGIAITGGTLKIGNASALGTVAGATSLGSGASLDLNGFTLGAEPLLCGGGTLLNSAASAAGIGGPVTLTAGSLVTGPGDIVLSGAIGGNFMLTKTGANTLTLGGASSRSGALAVNAGTVLVTGNAGPGPVNVAAGATLGGGGTLGGDVTVAGTLDLGSAVSTLTVSGNLTLQPGSTTRLKIQKNANGVTTDRIVVGGALNCGGTVMLSVGGLPLVAGDTVQLFSAGSVTGTFANVQLPYLYGDLIWDGSALASTGVLKAIALPVVSTAAQRRDWLLTRAAESPGAINGSVMAAAYFARGDIAQGQALALSTSRAMLANYQNGAVQVDLFDYWPALDLAIRYGQYLDAETQANLRQIITHFIQYKDTNTGNLQTLAWTVRFLGGELYGEDAFTSLGIANYWRTNDVNARQQLLSQFASRATGGFPEFASRPYYWKDVLPFLSIGQLSQDSAMRQAATLSFESAMAQNAGYWMRGHLGMPTGRSYPDVLDQFPVTSLGMLWFYFGGNVPALNMESAVFTAVMNQPISDIITLAGSDRSAGFRSRSYVGNNHQDAYNDRDYVLFSDGPVSYGNFQVYPNGVVWCDADLSHYSFLWVAKPWRDDSGITVSNPHGRNTAYYKEAQSHEAVAYIYNIPATGDPIPYALGYVPGGYRASINEAATSGNVFLHYGTVMISIRSENTFTWDPNSGIDFQAAPARPGDSEFRIYGTVFGVAIETANPSDYAGATPADQLAAFRADILAKTSLQHLNGAATPTALYNNRRGETIQVALSKVPSTLPIAINGLPTNYNVWPMLENPWMYQRVNDPLLTLYAPGKRELLDFTTWTRTYQNGPVVDAPASAIGATAGQSIDLDLSGYAQPAAGDPQALRFSLGSPSIGTATLLADGHTARYTAPAGYNGTASFTATARATGVDPAVLVFLYDYAAPETLTDNLVTDRSGHRLDATLSVLGTGACSLVTDAPAALVTTQSLQLTEAAPAAVRMTRSLGVTQHDLGDASWTFATWVKRTTRTNDDFVLYLGAGSGFGSAGDELQLYFPAGADTLNLRHYSTAQLLDVNLTTPATATPGSWHHVAVTFTRTGVKTGVVRLYLDGTLCATSAPVTWALDQSDPLVIGGCTATTGTGPAACLNGRFAETALFNKALADTNIAVLQTHTVAQVTGLSATIPMTLTVLTPYNQWRQTWFATTANTGTASDVADPDGDGLPNLLEYALGGNPLKADPALLPTVSMSGARLQFTFQRIRADLTYIVEASSDMSTWTTIATNPGTVGQSVTVSDSVYLSPSTQPRRFLRLRVTLP